ncbi:MAG: hypothetical protein P2A85_02845 [Microcoleus anatoxicus]|uniref:hypothetical protein n=1 Tax=Microcoleus anatoxicus TaxID=2705319 RepID=UPI003673116C
MVGEPAPTGWLEMYIEIIGGVGAGLWNFGFSIYMVGEPAPTGWLEMYIEIVGGVGRVYEILGFPSIWLVNPPLQDG